MTGAESLIRTLARAGTDVCFANPGTTELPLVTALDAAPGVRAVLGLFEGVCTGAADGWARMTGRPAATLLHLGPGLANGLANLHNARRARTPVLNLVGDHATWHLAADAPLASDIPSLARPVSAWVRTAQSAQGLAADGAEALAAAWGPPGGVATLIVRADCQWEEADGPVAPPPRPTAMPAPEADLAAAAAALRAGSAVLLLGAGALSERGLCAAARIQGACGCAVFLEGFAARIERGQGLPAFPRLPYFPEQVAEALAGRRTLVLAGAPPPVAFFAYPGQPSRLTPEGCATQRLAGPEHDLAAALEDVADRLGAGPLGPLPARERPAPATGPLTPESLGRTLAALQPEAAVVVDEAATSGLGWSALAAAAPPHTVLSLTGGAIGQGLPCATGAALACPDRRVVAFQADGSALYTLQALWTQARERLPVVTVICANRRYRILQVELARAGIAEPGPAARALTDLGSPDLDWVALARGFGVEAWRAESAEAFGAAFSRALAATGPTLVEAVLGA
jgi:acetolactate synthase I/II/III large subunit